MNKDNKIFLVKQDYNKRDTLLTVRTFPNIKREFDSIRRFYGYTQAEFLGALVAYAQDQAIRDGYVPQQEVNDGLR